MKTRYHLCLDVRGVLSNWKPRELRGMFTHDDRRPCTAKEAKDHLLYELSKGHLKLPLVPCEGFDYVHGCPGHPEPEVLS